MPKLRQAKEYDVYVPLRYNNGKAVEPWKIESIGERLLDEFGGLTFFPQPNQGHWRMGPVTFRDEIVVFRVLTEKVRPARRFFHRFKAALQEELKQEEVLIVEKDAKVF